MRTLPVIIAGLSIALVPLFAYTMLQRPEPCGFGHTALLQTSKQTLSVFLALSTEEQATGLGGCTNLARKTGMYFPFSVSKPQTFWMKGMVIPIDIVWISNGIVVGVEKGVPAPSRKTPESELPLYHSPQHVDAVVEVDAGMAGAYGLVEGSHVVVVNL